MMKFLKSLNEWRKKRALTKLSSTIEPSVGTDQNSNEDEEEPKRSREILIWVLLFVISFAVALFVFVSTNEKVPEQTQHQPTATAQKAAPVEKPIQEKQSIPTSRKVLGVAIILLVSGVFFFGARSQWESGKKLYQQKFWWHPMAVVVYCIIATYLLIAFLLPEFWNFLWEDQIFFWSLTLGIIVLAKFKTMEGADGKPLPAARKAAVVFGIFLVIGLSTQIAKNPYWKERWDKMMSSIPNRTPAGVSVSRDVPVEIAKRVVCECESNCQQFEPGTKNPLKNKGIPEKNIPPSDAFGIYQFREIHRKPAFDLGYDLNTEFGQNRYFEHLYAKEGFGPWNHDEQYGGGRVCWGPKLAALGYGQGTRTPVQLAEAVDVPTDEWSKEVNTTGHRKVCWSRIDLTKGGTCEVMLDRDPKMVFPIKAQTGRVGLKILQFKCSEAGARVEVSSSN